MINILTVFRRNTHLAVYCFNIASRVPPLQVRGNYCGSPSPHWNASSLKFALMTDALRSFFMIWFLLAQESKSSCSHKGLLVLLSSCSHKGLHINKRQSYVFWIDFHYS